MNGLMTTTAHATPNPCPECKGLGKGEYTEDHPGSPYARSYTGECHVCGGDGRGVCPRCDTKAAALMGDCCASCLTDQLLEAEHPNEGAPMEAVSEVADVQTSGQKSPAEALKDAFWNLKRSRIRIVPTHTSRASSIGNDCERFLFYERTAAEMRTPHNEALQAIFDLGNHLEKFVVRELEEMGVDVTQRNRDFHERELEFTGHLDGVLSARFFIGEVPCEIKGLNPFTADKIETLGDIRDSHTSWVRKYYAQLQSYLHLGKGRWQVGVFVLMNKVSGQFTFIDCPYDLQFCLEQEAKLARVRDAVAANVAPSRNQSDDCQRCAFKHVCNPDVVFGAGAKVIDKDELIAALKKRESLRDAKRDYEAADKAVKAMLPEEACEVIAGNFGLVGKKQERKSFHVNATSFIRWTVRELSPTTAAAPVTTTEAKESNDEF